MMLSPYFESAISAAGAPMLTEVFIWTLIVVLIASIFLKKTGRLNAFTLYAPTLLTSLGMLGTFIGIVAGLLEFDPANIDGSIELLLAGLKTAFITSLVGMLFSIFFKGLSATGLINSKRQAKQPAEAITTGHLYEVMQQQVDAIKDLKKSIGGDNENSLVGQFKLMRSDIMDGQRNTERALKFANEHLQSLSETAHQQQKNFADFEQRLVIKLQEFAEMLSESATKQVIEALEDVIKDFNNKLTEQFGENFKQLNAAVLELVTWQENYKQQLSDMKAQYDQGVIAIEKTEGSVASIAENTGIIPIAMSDLTQVMEVNQHQIEELARHLDAFAETRDKAVEAIPEIQQQITHVLEGARQASDTMAKGVLDSTETLTQGIAGSTQSLTDSIAGGVSTMSETVSGSTELLKTSIAGSTQKLEAGILQSTGSLVTAVTASGNTLKDKVSESAESLKNALKQSSDNMAAGVNSSSSDLVSAVKGSSDKIAEGINSSITDLMEAVKNSAGNMTSEVTTSTTELVSAVKSSSETMAAGINTSATDFLSTMKDSTENMTEGVNGSAKELVSAVKNSAEHMVAGVTKSSDHLAQSVVVSADNLQERVTKSAESYQAAINESSKALTELTGNMSDYAGNINRTLTESTNKIREENSELIKQLQTGNQELLNGFQLTKSEIDQLQKQLVKSINEAAQVQIGESQKVLTALEKNIEDTVNKALEETAKVIKGEITDISNATAQHCNNVLQQMADDLVSITGKFTSDYKSLVGEMDGVIRYWKNKQ
ncbi:hypothetical protein [Endozoicomonas sp.]|uniref:hypothetical protein n=1 Tax=Endozoicomonas sp. TaxID=1892382 RepID=UPI00383BCFE0